MSFKKYYESVKETYTFRIKTTGRLGEEELDVIEKIVSKYRPDSISAPKKMMFQTNPLGFTGVKNVEIWFVDVVLTVPVLSTILALELKTEFGLVPSSPHIVVTGDNDNPIADQEEELAKPHDTALLLDNDFSEAPEVDAEEHYGDKFNKKLLAYIAKAEKERELEKKVDAPHPITRWSAQKVDLEPKQDLTNFNDMLDK